MSIRGILCAFGVIGAIEASVIMPSVSKAQLAETMTSSAISGQLHSMQKSNLLTPGRKAKGIASLANQRRAYENQALEETPVAPSSKGVDSANIVQFDAKTAVPGKSYIADGIVLSDEVKDGKRVVLVLKVSDSNSFQVLAFRVHDQAMPAIPKNTLVRASGVYASKFKEPKSGAMVPIFDDAMFEAGQVAQSGTTAPGAGTTAPIAVEKPTFESIMKGWVLRGTVQIGGKATAVFVNEDHVKYAQVGTVIDKGLRVVKVKNGEAGVVVDGKRFDVTPW